jgi:hypothetical protein
MTPEVSSGKSDQLPPQIMVEQMSTFACLGFTEMGRLQLARGQQ